MKGRENSLRVEIPLHIIVELTTGLGGNIINGLDHLLSQKKRKSGTKIIE